MGKPALAPLMAVLAVLIALCPSPGLAYGEEPAPEPRDPVARIDAHAAEGGEAGARALLPFLCDPDPDVRTHAQLRLVGLGKDAVEPLLSVIGQEENRWLVSGALVNIGAPAVPAAIRAMDDPSPAVRRNVLFVLRQIEAREAIPVVRKALSDPDRSVQIQALHAIAQFGGEEQLQAVLAKVDSESPSVRDTAVTVLPRFGPIGIAAMTSLLSYGKPEVRATAMREVGMIGTAEMRPFLRKGLEDPSAPVRFYAAEALGETNDPMVLQDLAGLLDDPDMGVRDAASEAFARMVGSGQSLLLRFLREGNALQKISAASAFRKARHRPAVPALVEAMRDRTPEVKVAAVAALMTIEDPVSVEDLVNGLSDPEVRWICVMALRKFGDSNLRPLLQRGSDPLLNHWKQYVLDGMGSRILEGCLDTLGKEENQDVKMATLCSMRQIKDTRAVLPLVALLGDEKLGFLAASVLAQMGEIAVEPLLLALRDADAGRRARAAEALADIGTPRALKPVGDLLCDENDEVRRAARRAVRRLGGEIPAGAVDG